MLILLHCYTTQCWWMGLCFAKHIFLYRTFFSDDFPNRLRYPGPLTNQLQHTYTTQSLIVFRRFWCTFDVSDWVSIERWSSQPFRSASIYIMMFFLKKILQLSFLAEVLFLKLFSKPRCVRCIFDKSLW